MPIRRIVLVSLGLILGIVLVACGSSVPGGGGDGGGDDGSGGGSGVSQLGFVSSSDDPAANETSFGGGFVDFGQALPSDFLNDPFAGETLGCEVFVADSADFPEFPSPIDGPVGGLTPTFIDAGTALTVSSSATSFSATLTSIATGSYATTSPVSGSLPADAVLDVPGAAGGFPAFAAAPFPDVGGFAVTVSPVNDFDAITVDSTYAWTASSGPALVTIEAASFSFDGTSFTYVGFSCLVDDADESLALPAAVKTELTNEGFGTGTLLPLTATRTGYSIETSGSAALVLGAESQATDPTP